MRHEGWRRSADRGVAMRQGYLQGGARCSTRVRIAGDRAWLNLKSATVGVRRLEFEYPIPVADAEQILANLCEGPLVEKTRYCVPVGDHVWEVDCFEGDNAGLVVAEVELNDPDEAFVRPDWAGPEVSGEIRYYNSSLVAYPFRRWTAEERRAHDKPD